MAAESPKNAIKLDTATRDELVAYLKKSEPRRLQAEKLLKGSTCQIFTTKFNAKI